jgi:tRNA pseudouridine32 synthase/23S rRNA pseudouridine746 synthase
MFGVLVVRNAAGEMGFLAAFSGNLAGSNCHEYFVPPVYDMLQPDEFFRVEEAEISAINRRVTELQQSDEYLRAKQNLESMQQRTQSELSQMKRLLAEHKANRDERRKQGEDEAQLILESQRDNADMQRLKRRIKEEMAAVQERFSAIEGDIAKLKSERQQRSATLQMRLFEQFRMLNARGEVKDLCELFAPTSQGIPPAGAGECAAPKLLQYAYLNALTPIAMAEFWQGASPRGEVRHHGAFYPACIGKCKPILEWMLQGLDVEANPLKEICVAEPTILWEDEYMVAIDKPCGMLSVRGLSGVRSVEEWAAERYPTISSPMIVHRLDQSTSGILLLAKDKATHAALQQQFIKQSVAKSYIALLDGVVKTGRGRIELRQRLDYENRPRQMICPDGKLAITEYEVIEIESGRTRILFHPITGRTHQLRLHAAHTQGLGIPIVGDDIYGHKCGGTITGKQRLCLHACEIEFSHPHTGRRIKIESKADF